MVVLRTIFHGIDGSNVIQYVLSCLHRKASVKERDNLALEDQAREEASYAALNVEIPAHM